MIGPVEEFERFLMTTISGLAREEPITFYSVRSKIPPHQALGGLTDKQVLKTILKLAAAYRRQGRFGRFRAALLLGSALAGINFVVRIERAGVLLRDEGDPPKFRQFLEHLSAEAGGSDNDGWRFLSERLRTYLAYEQLASATAANDRSALRPLRADPGDTIKKILALTHLRFLSYLNI